MANTVENISGKVVTHLHTPIPSLASGLRSSLRRLVTRLPVISQYLHEYDRRAGLVVELEKTVNQLLQAESNTIPRHFVTSSPTHQNAVDLFPGAWATALPGVQTSGDRVSLDGDLRMADAAQAFGGLEGFKVLELGPLEGAHSCQLEKLGCAEVTAIESKVDSFLRCLVTKNLLNLRTTFLLGDFRHYLNETDKKFDLIVAAGVLYHMTDPVELIYSITQRCDRVYLWTMHFDREVIQGNAGLRFAFRADKEESVERRGFKARYHKRLYENTNTADASFYGGDAPGSIWMELSEIIDCFEHFGFDVVSRNHECANSHGSSISLTFRRRNLAR